MVESEAIRVIKILNFCGLCTTGPCGGCERKQAKEEALSALEEIQQYRSIGTVEECRAAAEKQRAKKPIKGRIFKSLGYYQCQICGGLFMRNEKFCSQCGQAIDYSE